jgi:hypothetical protein
MLPGQQAAPVPPHGGTHVPFVQVPPFDAHVAPFATHPPVSQHPPFAHVPVPPSLLGQQACCGLDPPQFWQLPLTHVPLVHGDPLATHWLPPAVSQQPVPLHMLPAQHASRAAPHAWHVPFEQTLPAVEHCMSFA